ncbi:hypothetical protein ACIBAC_00730 [Streptomyces sp. NPDC051362]|uniref:hypothetical protein n=1 Tax=Streptomyces sp. NPDC051362 TaxID=3365651 RepID=UPI0037997056
MAQRIVYKVTNADVLLGPDAEYRFRAPAAPAGSVATINVYGRPTRVRVCGHTVDDGPRGRVEAAEFVDVYL